MHFESGKLEIRKNGMTPGGGGVVCLRGAKTVDLIRW